MKKIVFIALLTMGFASRSQVTFSSLILNTHKSELPYTPAHVDGESADRREDRTLNEPQKQYVLSKLRAIAPTTIFKEDYPGIEELECNNCLDSGENDQVKLAAYFKWGNDFLLHLYSEQGGKKRGILACVNSKGEWLSWIVSDGSISVDDNRGLLRSIDIAENGNININENFFQDRGETHSYAYLTFSGKTADGKYIPFGTFVILNSTTTRPN